MTSTLIAINSSGELLQHPSAKQIRSATSVHVLAFSSHGNLLVVESQGEFSINVWEKVYEMAKIICRGTDADDKDNEDMNMDLEQQTSLEKILRITIHEKTVKEQKWKENTA